MIPYWELDTRSVKADNANIPINRLPKIIIRLMSKVWLELLQRCNRKEMMPII